jgi:hypothetical protein
MMNPTMDVRRVRVRTRGHIASGGREVRVAERAVTISVSYPVAAGEEAEFEAWSRLRLAESADRPGYLGGQVLAPPSPGPDWFIVHRFENERAASSWESWFRESPGIQQAGDIEWKVEGAAPAPNGRPVTPGRPTNGRVGAAPAARRPVDERGRPGARPPVGGRPYADVRAAGAGRGTAPPPPPPGVPDIAPPRNGRPRPVEPERPVTFTGPNGRPRRPAGAPGSGTPPRPVAAATPAPAPPRQAGPPPLERRPYEPARNPIEPLSAPLPAAPERPSTRPPGTQPSPVASVVLTAGAVVLFTAIFETVIAPLLAGGPVLLRIVLLSVVISLAVSAVRPPGLRRWLANLLVPVAVRNRWEAEGRPDPDDGTR